ncbi:hypothetical protein ACFYVL_06140 [Streptomyces sp. NPDC004111]|uniref:hypothetical protein n=1 Tax=Streptomyces sp. NPDC004111 TaxID=3364690 RepID=UPI0036C0DE71
MTTDDKGTTTDEKGMATDDRKETGSGTKNPAARPSALRRLVPTRTALRPLRPTRTAVTGTALVLAGALLGAGTVAWRTDTLPLLKPAPCWNSLSDTTLDAMFRDLTLKVDEQALESDRPLGARAFAQCRITSHRRESGRVLTRTVVRVHTLDGMDGDESSRWPDEYLSSHMVALGGDLPGLASPTRGWLALPQSCEGAGSHAITVVDVAVGEQVPDQRSPYDLQDRDAVTRVLVDAANGAVRALGCSGVYRAPERLPAVPEWRPAVPDAFCGVRGLGLPGRYRQELELTRVGGAGGAARTCDAGSTGSAKARMSTVVAPELAEALSYQIRRGGVRVEGTKGHGALGPAQGMYVVPCQTGDVVMRVDVPSGEPLGGRGDFVRELFPAYVEAEAARLGCGPEKVRTPAARPGAY